MYSPDIDNFSEEEDIFDISNKDEQVIKINNGILEIYKGRPKKTFNKILKPDGLVERFRILTNKRLIEGCNFVISRETSNHRKIEIIENCFFRRQLLFKFRFIEDFETPDFDKLETHHFAIFPYNFHKFIEQHVTYEVAFESEREFMSNHFVHFGKLIKAARRFQS